MIAVKETYTNGVITLDKKVGNRIICFIFVQNFKSLL